MTSLTIIQDELEMLLKISVSLLILVVLSLYNYIRTLNKEMLLEDILLIRSIMRGKHVRLKKDGRVVVCSHHSCKNYDSCRKDEEPICEKKEYGFDD
jgi:hypothetical protein